MVKEPTFDERVSTVTAVSKRGRRWMGRNNLENRKREEDKKTASLHQMHLTKQVIKERARKISLANDNACVADN